ncbi:unnamed protein product [Peniophora sp. CBMAI 1063]|nr:unnamed protein product [Peniophora sp. CBMAI 1063]
MTWPFKLQASGFTDTPLSHHRPTRAQSLARTLQCKPSGKSGLAAPEDDIDVDEDGGREDESEGEEADGETDADVDAGDVADGPAYAGIGNCWIDDGKGASPVPDGHTSDPAWPKIAPARSRAILLSQRCGRTQRNP